MPGVRKTVTLDLYDGDNPFCPCTPEKRVECTEQVSIRERTTDYFLSVSAAIEACIRAAERAPSLQEYGAAFAEECKSVGTDCKVCKDVVRKALRVLSPTEIKELIFDRSMDREDYL